MANRNIGWAGARSFDAAPNASAHVEAAIREEIFNADPLDGNDAAFAAQRWRHHCIWLIDRLEAERADHRIAVLISIVCFFLALSYYASRG